MFFFSDPMTGVLALVNLLAIAMLFPVALRLVRDYRAQLADGVELPVFDPSEWRDLDIDATAWSDVRPRPAVQPTARGVTV